MMKNIEKGANALSDMIGVKAHCVKSMSLTEREDAVLMLMAMPKGEAISEEEYQMDTAFYVISGILEITSGDETMTLKSGEIAKIGKGTLHALYAKEDVKLLEISL